MNDERPPQWGEPGYRAPLPTYAERVKQRNKWRGLTIGFGVFTLLTLPLGLYAGFTMPPDQESFGAAQLTVFGMYGAVITAVFAWQWRKASKKIQQHEYRD